MSSPEKSTNPFLPEDKVTTAMATSLQQLKSCLLCPLCNQVMTDPSTLHCAHSFCRSCIDALDTWSCPCKCLLIRMIALCVKGYWLQVLKSMSHALFSFCNVLSKRSRMFTANHNASIFLLQKVYRHQSPTQQCRVGFEQHCERN